MYKYDVVKRRQIKVHGTMIWEKEGCCDANMDGGDRLSDEI